MVILRLEEMFPADVAAQLRIQPQLVLPFGTIEWHSHHLPLGLDGMVAQAISEGIAARLGAILAPVSYWAVGGVPYPYTLHLTAAQIEPLLVAVFEQFGAMGYRVLTAFTGHFGLEQTLILKRAAVTAMRDSPVTILPWTEYDLVTDLYLGDHAALGETSILWSLRPDLVRLAAVPDSQPLDGIIGADPRQGASAAYGAQLIEAIVARSAEVAQRALDEAASARRQELIDTLQVAVQVLEMTLQARVERPKPEVPPITTPAYLAACQALYHGDYQGATAHLQRKLIALAA